MKSNNLSKNHLKNGYKKSFENMKLEIANEFGVDLGLDSSSHNCFKTSGEITKRLIEKGMNSVRGSYNNR